MRSPMSFSGPHLSASPNQARCQVPPYSPISSTGSTTIGSSGSLSSTGGSSPAATIVLKIGASLNFSILFPVSFSYSASVVYNFACPSCANTGVIPNKHNAPTKNITINFLTILVPPKPMLFTLLWKALIFQHFLLESFPPKLMDLFIFCRFCGLSRLHNKESCQEKSV